MDLHTLQTFFMWMTIIDACLLVFYSLMLIIMGDFVYNMHNKFFPMTREAFNLANYSTIAFFKILFFVFNLVPYIALLIIAK